jgi:hypothetical protein
MIDVPAGYAGVATFSVNSSYCPRGDVNGSVSCPNNANDSNKIVSSTISSTGNGIIVIASALAGAEQVYFTYPLKTS